MATEKRLIALDDLLKFPIRIDHYDRENGNEHFVFGVETVLEYAENLPTVDAVEVIRCNECRWYLQECECCQFWHGRRQTDHFCGEGERRTDNG